MLVAAIALIFYSVSVSARCVDKYYGTAECLQRCQSKMGYSGMVSGGGRWDAVILPANSAQWTVSVSQACGLSSSSVSGAKAAAAPPPDSSSSVTTNPASSTLSPTTTSSGTTTQPTVSVSRSTNTVASSSSTTTSKPPPAQTTVTTRPSTPTTTTRPTTTSTSTSTRKSSSETPPPQSTTRLTTAPKSTPTSSSPPKFGGSGTSSSDIQAYLTSHNKIRSQHDAQDLTWSDELASSAQDWANQCQFKHSQSGENLAAGTGDAYDIAAAVKSWTDEVKDYDPNNPQPSHFTQVIWKGSTRLGCGKQLCSGIFPPEFGKALYVVCHYGSAGNVLGHFSENVQV